jgi:AbrB family looped-hinge helix DNA binding protein
MGTEILNFFLGLSGGRKMDTTTIQIRRKGVITLPAALRKRYGWSEGDAFTVQDLGDGTLVLLPLVSRLTSLGDRVAEILEEDGVSTQEILDALDEEREHYYGEHYA